MGGEGRTDLLLFETKEANFLILNVKDTIQSVMNRQGRPILADEAIRAVREITGASTRTISRAGAVSRTRRQPPPHSHHPRHTQRRSRPTLHR